MAEDQTRQAQSQAAATKTPFDWLQGSIFFGGSGGSRNAGSNNTEVEQSNSENYIRDDDNDDNNIIDNCTDVVFLINGISESILRIIQESGRLSNVPMSSEQLSIDQKGFDDTQQISKSIPDEGSVSVSDRIAIRLARLRYLLYEERRRTSQHNNLSIQPIVADVTVGTLTDEKFSNLFPLLLEHMSLLPFESRKHVVAIFNYILVCGLEGVDSMLYVPCMVKFVAYINSQFEQIMSVIVQGHDLTRQGISPDIGLHFGSMYRSCTRHPTIYQNLVGSRDRAERFVYPFLDEYVHVANFEIASDAMESLRCAFAANNTERIDATTSIIQGSNMDVLSEPKIPDVAADFLNRDYVEIWDHRFTPKLLSDSANYMSRRVALQILSTVLLTRSNYAVMIRYVANRSNLIVVMQLLRDTSPHITLDAFHVFKVFVANPNKPPEIKKILHDNKIKLCAYLKSLHQEKEETDTQFRDEKALIIATIDAL